MNKIRLSRRQSLLAAAVALVLCGGLVWIAVWAMASRTIRTNLEYFVSDIKESRGITIAYDQLNIEGFPTHLTITADNITIRKDYLGDKDVFTLPSLKMRSHLWDWKEFTLSIPEIQPIDFPFSPGIEARLVFAPALPRISPKNMQQWHDSDGTLYVQDIIISAKNQRLSIDGTLKLDKELQPVGELSIKSENWHEVLETLKEGTAAVFPKDGTSSRMLHRTLLTTSLSMIQRAMKGKEKIPVKIKNRKIVLLIASRRLSLRLPRFLWGRDQEEPITDRQAANTSE